MRTHCRVRRTEHTVTQSIERFLAKEPHREYASMCILESESSYLLSNYTLPESLELWLYNSTDRYIHFDVIHSSSSLTFGNCLIHRLINDDPIFDISIYLAEIQFLFSMWLVVVRDPYHYILRYCLIMLDRDIIINMKKWSLIFHTRINKYIQVL